MGMAGQVGIFLQSMDHMCQAQGHWRQTSTTSTINTHGNADWLCNQLQLLPMLGMDSARLSRAQLELKWLSWVRSQIMWTPDLVMMPAAVSPGQESDERAQAWWVLYSPAWSQGSYGLEILLGPFVHVVVHCCTFLLKYQFLGLHSPRSVDQGTETLQEIKSQTK